MSHTQSAVHLLPPTDPTKMLAILTNERGDLLAYVGAKGMPNEANARRIVASWNACLEIPIEALENGVVAQLLDELEIFLADLEANIADGRCGYYHRDGANESDPCPMHAYRDRLTALVAKAKGQPTT